MKTKATAAQDTPEAPAPEASPTGIYEVMVDGPVKVGGVLAYRTARLFITQAHAAAINAHQPGALHFIGI